ncbi:nose resistant to fluoxetine protein 6-like [Sinocyclocheilus grahami]|uniref:nose resistant to fluoxetine protein 6-like n=1 Tax=Sinocyclocheilus grahami TaxID=75366 RepID=UPI0007AD2406|nr:PREDICTED: nose resistant to fluoxetine protein 6-like [Sinocyclocheilus grahami]
MLGLTWSAVTLIYLLDCHGSCAWNVSLKCKEDTTAFLMELQKETPSKYAVLMYDAFGKVGSDVEGENVNRPGSLREFLPVEGPEFRGQYCQVFLKQDRVEYFVGVCVPDSCTESEVQPLVFYGFVRFTHVRIASCSQVINITSLLISRNKSVLDVVSVVLLMISSITGALITSFLHLPVHQPTTLAYKSYFQYYYNKPYTRYGPYLLGILAGIYMTTKKETLIKQQWQAVIGWLCSLSVMALLVGLVYVLRDVPPYLSLPHAVYQGTHCSLWALALVWIILACEEGYGGFVDRILSLGLWAPLSNISFACYLIHPIIIILYNGKQETTMHDTDFNFIAVYEQC